MQSSSLLGSVFERVPSSSKNVAPSPSNLTAGFPVAQHRSKGKSAFARRREQENKPGASSRLSEPPVLVNDNRERKVTSENNEEQKPTVDANDWRTQVSRENELRVANMTNEEREQEKQEILERFGLDVGDILRKARDRRGKTGGGGE